MKKTLLSFTALGSMLAVLFLTALPARAENMETRIQAMEDEIARLKAEQAQTKELQMELKKEATLAKKKRPSFRYRPRSGLRIRAGDRSWEIRFGYVFHGRIAFWPGDQQDAAVSGGGGNRTDGEYFGRRNRFSLAYRFNKGFYELFYMQDADAGDFTIQRSMFTVRYDRINPWLPRFYIGMDIPQIMNKHDSNWSSSSSGHLERSMLVRSTFGVNTGGSQTGFGLLWRRLPMGPGDFTVQWRVISGSGEGDGAGTDSDRHDFSLFVGTRPLNKSKNKWLKGIDFGVGFLFANHDSRAGEDGTNRIRIRDHRQVAEDGDGSENRIELFRTTVGDGYMNYITPGFGWRIGPYRLRVAGAFASAEDKDNGEAGAKRGSMFSIAHELFVWSPKGPFTGNANGPNSVMLSWLFERDNASCKGTGEDSGFCARGGEFSRNHVRLRELTAWWFVRRNVSVGVSWLWYEAANVRGDNNDQVSIGCTRNTVSAADRAGKSCDWHNVVLGLRVGF